MKTIKKIPCLLGYYASSEGKILSRRKRRKMKGVRGGTVAYIGGKYREIKQKNDNKYLRVGLVKDGKQRLYSVHRLILETFTEKCPKGMQACHNDGNSKNNDIVNLRWDTPKNNQKDRIIHNTTNEGEKIGTSKLTEKQVRIIKHALSYSIKGTAKQLAKMCCVDRNTIGRINTNITWKHIII